jgi:chloramphenicol-sensitive protein RarD
VPTMIFLIAVFVFGEDFGPARMIAFPMIWTALIIYTVSLLRQTRKSRRAAASIDD